MLPKSLRRRAIHQAHSSTMGGHQGIRKTTNKVLSDVKDAVARFCRECNNCQKTMTKKGCVRKVELGKMPIIDTPFKRVAADLVGPIHPSSKNGHRYIPTRIDYATRYSEAVPLKNIDTETVAEALVDFYSRLEYQKRCLAILERSLFLTV